MDANSNYALATALKQAGVKLKATFFATGYEPGVINSPVWQSVQGGYFLTLFRPFSLPNAGTQQMAGRHAEVRALHERAVPDTSPSTRRGRGPT